MIHFRFPIALFGALLLVAPGTAAENLIVNGDFENGLNNWTWTGDGVDNVATLSTDTPSGTGQSADLDINQSLGLPWLIQDVPVTAGDVLTFSASVREVRQFQPNFDAWIAAQVWMLPNSESGQIITYNFAFYTNPNWETQGFEITVPANATVARVLFTPQDPDFSVGTGRYRIDNVRLELPGLTGDYNKNGTVDAADYVIWRGTLNSTTNLAADGNANLVIDDGDYSVWKSSFGATSAGGGSALGTSAVPEPAALAFLPLLAWLLPRNATRLRS